jgi:uncharacterized protein (TIGR02246 family)
MKRHWFHYLAAPSALAAVGVLTALSLLHGRDGAQGARADDEDKPKPAATRPSGKDGRPGDEVRQASAAYMEALNKGDLDAIVAFWGPDADYVDESGKMTRGREAIAVLFKKSVAELKGSKFKGQIHSLKFLRPEVALVDGSVEITSSDGTRDSNRHAVIWAKSGDKWLISSARDLPAETDKLPCLAYGQIKCLEWLVGEWHDQSDKIDVQVSCRWAPNKSFLILDYTVKHQNEEPVLVTQRVGWDPRNQMIRSWVFDSKGGFGEGNWERQGNRWIVGMSGILPDGGTGTATNIYEFVNTDAFVWHSKDREVDGQPVADVEVKFARKAGKGKEAP